jgi:oleandomycin transport system permease protein
MSTQTITTESGRGAAADRIQTNTPPPRPLKPASSGQQAMALAWRVVRKIRHVPEQLLDVTLQPILFIALFVFVFGGGLFGDWHQALQYLLPGIMVQGVVFATVSIGTGLNNDLSKGIFDRFRSLPIGRAAPLVGAVLGEAVRYALSGAVVLIFGFILGFRLQHTNPLGLLAGYVLVVGFALCMCWSSVLLGILAKTPESVQGLAFLTLFPLTFGSNIFAQTSTMPGWLQAWVNVNPITHLANAERGLLIGGPVAWPVLQTVLWGIGFFAVFFPLAVAGYRRRSS